VPDAGDTVAVNVTACPNVEGFGEDASARTVGVVVATFTVFDQAEVTDVWVAHRA
jgi:hypothetical protein